MKLKDILGKKAPAPAPKKPATPVKPTKPMKGKY